MKEIRINIGYVLHPYLPQMNVTLCVFLLLSFTVCYGHRWESTTENVSKGVDTKQMNDSTLTPVIQHSFDNHSFHYEWFAALPIGLFILSVCCMICCRSRYRKSIREQEVLTIHPPPPQFPSGIIIDQHPPPPGFQTDLPPPYPTQPLAPPPYDTQPTWGPSAPLPPHQQFPTSYTNPNYVQPPANAEYSQEKY